MADFIEPILDKMQTLFEAGLEDKFDALDDEYDDGIELEDIKTYFKGRNFSITQTPSITIWPDDAPGNEELDQDKLQIQYRIVTYAVLSSEVDSEKMWKRLFRTARGMVEIIRVDFNLGGTVDICKFGGFTYESPWLAVRESAYIGVIGIIWNVQNEEVL